MQFAKKIIKVKKKIIQDFWDIFQQLRILLKSCRLAALDTLYFKGLNKYVTVSIKALELVSYERKFPGFKNIIQYEADLLLFINRRDSEIFYKGKMKKDFSLQSRKEYFLPFSSFQEMYFHKNYLVFTVIYPSYNNHHKRLFVFHFLILILKFRSWMDSIKITRRKKCWIFISYIFKKKIRQE